MILDPKTIQPIRGYLSNIRKDLGERAGVPKLSINTLPALNRKIWGLKEGLTVIGGRTSQGKSALALQIAFDLAGQSIPVLFLSLEMTVEALIERLFCNIEEVDNYSILTGRFKNDLEIQAKWKTFTDYASKIPLLITCGIGKNFQEINKLVPMINPEPKVVIVDYVQAIVTKAGQSREMINEYIRYFRQLAIEKKFAGVLCSQINRGAEETRRNEPHLYQLKETGVLEEHADTVLLLHWPNFYTRDPSKVNEFKINIAKQRNGRTGEHNLIWKPEYYKFTEKVIHVDESGIGSIVDRSSLR
ncbi:MAG: AAA family ATPase [Candidatus Omnitrophica bacterium]|nr:AAA family ATPase [Candidatus Omnitrophota bacterium]